jgi:large subunit ribosomal protein L11
MDQTRGVQSKVRLTIPAGKASPAPPIGPVLGQRGINIQQFCKAFNAATSAMAEGVPVTTRVIVYSDRTFDMSIGTVPTSHMVREAMRKAGRGFITQSDLADIARAKLPSLNTNSLDGAIRTIEGTVRSMHTAIADAGH